MNDSPAVSLSFRSDNVATVAPEIMRALEAANHGLAAAYGDDEYSAFLNRKFSELFETDVTVFPVSTGTAANALSLATCARPYGAIYCHEDAHINTAEGGATEAFSGGAKLIALPGVNGKLEPQAVSAALERADRGVTNRSQPDAVSITQATEYGTVYTLEHIAAFGAIARDAGIFFHMDGARFANALVALKCSAAEMTWRKGVDILSFGATKNGAMGADAIVVFDRELVEPLSYRLRRAGQTWSKMRFAAAQLIAYVENDLFLRLASHANQLASQLGRELAAIPGVHVTAPVEANLVFPAMPEPVIEALTGAGVRFARRGAGVIRLVARFDATKGEVDQFVALVRRFIG
jgi:threonine aldolase